MQRVAVRDTRSERRLQRHSLRPPTPKKLPANPRSVLTHPARLHVGPRERRQEPFAVSLRKIDPSLFAGAPSMRASSNLPQRTAPSVWKALPDFGWFGPDLFRMLSPNTRCTGFMLRPSPILGASAAFSGACPWLACSLTVRKSTVGSHFCSSDGEVPPGPSAHLLSWITGPGDHRVVGMASRGRAGLLRMVVCRSPKVFSRRGKRQGTFPLSPSHTRSGPPVLFLRRIDGI